jgi:hypothetical protein
MTDLQHPTEEYIRGLEIYDYIWDDLSDGLITNEHGSIIKHYADQLNSTNTVLLREPLSGTGKSAKFIIDNAETPDNIPNIVVQDVFQNTFLYCGEFWDIVEEDPRVYQNPQLPDEIAYDEAGDIIGTTRTFPSGESYYMDLTVDPVVRSSEVLKTVLNDSADDMSRMVNANGDQLGTSDDSFMPELTVIFPFPISTGYPKHEAEGLVNQIISSLRHTVVGGVVILLDIHYDRVNQQMWRSLETLQDLGWVFETQWLLNSEDDETGAWKAAAIKRVQ